MRNPLTFIIRKLFIIIKSSVRNVFRKQDASVVTSIECNLDCLHLSPLSTVY